MVAAMKALERFNLTHAFDPFHPESRPSKKQQEIMDDMNLISSRFVIAGNRCLAKGTQVLTSIGIQNIEDIQIGDIVYDENGKEIKVIATHKNGIQEVHKLTHKGITWAQCTKNHVFLVKDSHGILRERKASEFQRDDRVKRNTLKASLGDVNESHAYAIAALLGDGCSRQKGKYIQMSSADDIVPNKVASILNGEVKRNSIHNYNWSLGTTECHHYDSWCKNRYAHEKIADIEVLKTWDRQSLVNFVAGLMDTDGSIHTREDGIVFTLSMQAKSVVDAFKWAVLTLWQVPLNSYVDTHKEYKNGPVYVVTTRNYGFIHQIMLELNEYLVSPQKKWRNEYDEFGKNINYDFYGLNFSEESSLQETFDITVDSRKNLYCLANGLVTHNSGKSSIPAREIGWLLTDTHPTWKKPADWGTQPWLILIGAQDLTMAATELWANKLKPFVSHFKWRELRQGNTLKSVTREDTGDTIVFLSHSDGSEKNRKHMQGYSAHYVWLDEVPASHVILDEMQNRVSAARARGHAGFFILTGTMKFRNDKIKKIIESAKAPASRKYTMSKFDNPIFQNSQKEEMLRLAGYSESERNAILYGDYPTGDYSVYNWDYDKMSVGELPSNYSKGWRHMEVVDPAMKSKCGYVLVAEDPGTGIWYMVNDSYIEGDSILDVDDLVSKIAKLSTGYNIVRRGTDVAPWFTAQAHKVGIHYNTIYDKAGRKDELIKNLQSMLSSGQLKIGRWCTNFIDEIQSCQWAENSDKMIQSSRYHTLDATQYFVDMKPKPEQISIVKPWELEIREESERYKKKKKFDMMLQNKTRYSLTPSHRWRRV